MTSAGEEDDGTPLQQVQRSIKIFGQEWLDFEDARFQDAKKLIISRQKRFDLFFSNYYFLGYLEENTLDADENSLILYPKLQEIFTKNKTNKIAFYLKIEQNTYDFLGERLVRLILEKNSFRQFRQSSDPERMLRSRRDQFLEISENITNNSINARQVAHNMILSSNIRPALVVSFYLSTLSSLLGERQKNLQKEGFIPSEEQMFLRKYKLGSEYPYGSFEHTMSYGEVANVQRLLHKRRFDSLAWVIKELWWHLSSAEQKVLAPHACSFCGFQEYIRDETPLLCSEVMAEKSLNPGAIAQAVLKNKVDFSEISWVDFQTLLPTVSSEKYAIGKLIISSTDIEPEITYVEHDHFNVKKYQKKEIIEFKKETKHTERIIYSEGFRKKSEKYSPEQHLEIQAMLQAFRDQWLKGENKMINTLHSHDGSNWELEKLHIPQKAGKKSQQKEKYGSYAIKSRERGDMAWHERLYVDVEGENVIAKYLGHI